MKKTGNVIKLIISIIIIALLVLGIVMIIRNISSLVDAYNGGKQTVISGNGTRKAVVDIKTNLRHLVF